MIERFEIELGSAEYPALLAASPSPPAILRGIGDPKVLSGPALAVVGARRATPYGLRAATEFAGWAAGAGWTIVSGAAVGCDQAAHRAAISAGGRTVAVLGCGADTVYPRGADELLSAVSRSGAVVSELDWGYPPAKWTFRARNRIIASLSDALLVVEAGLPSGTFSTADYALASGRDVLAVPGSIFAPECRGANRLIRQGATPITDVSELAEALGAIAAPSLPFAEPCAEYADDPVLRALLADPMRPDDVARALCLDIVSVARRIGVLQVAGLVAKYRDGRYGPC
ncbi:MAG: DNA-processing protein DprA [Coriobacteriia bacterium]